MRAILLAAGFGTRLRPITDKTPKCLVQIKNKPLLEIWLDNLVNSGVESFLINTHYLPDQVDAFVKNSIFKNYITIIKEKKLAGTAGTLLNNINYFQYEDGLLIHADNYSKESIKNFITAHRKRPDNCLMSVMCFRTDQPSNCGIFKINDKNIAIEFHEKVDNPPGNLANGAIYILSKEIIKILENNFNHCKDFSLEIIPFFLGKIYCYETNDIFLDIGTPENYYKANNL